LQNEFFFDQKTFNLLLCHVTLVLIKLENDEIVTVIGQKFIVKNI